MSIDYYFACARCQEAIHVGCTSNGDPYFQYYWSDRNCNEALTAFLAKHTVCGDGIVVSLVDEHNISDECLKSIAEWDWADRPANSADPAIHPPPR